jgi:hypothetical protein
MNDTIITDVLQYISDIGWSDLIDSRWREELIKDILDGFPDILEDELNEILNVVLI